MRSRVEGARALATGLLVALGLGNVALGVLAFATDLILLSPAISGGLVASGALTVSLGALVRRGRRWAVLVSLAVFGALLVAQAVEVAAGGAEGPAVARLVLIAAVVGSLAGVVATGGRRRGPAAG